jgi:uncharacterized protein YdiU (UPF0061 family)
MDYGPFGFLERFDPGWAMWVGADGGHFSYYNQPNAAAMNFGMFVKSLVPLLDAEGVAEAKRIFEAHESVSDEAVARTWARKLGFPADAPLDASRPVFAALEGLLTAHPTDFTIAFRQLIDALPALFNGGGGGPDALAALEPAFYEPLPAALAAAWREWLAQWQAALAAAGSSAPAAAAVMRAANPRFVPREWLLVEAYSAAERGDNSRVLALHRVLQRPYDEQPDAPAHFYRRAPPGTESRGGVGFMS